MYSHTIEAITLIRLLSQKTIPLIRPDFRFTDIVIKILLSFLPQEKPSLLKPLFHHRRGALIKKIKFL